MKTHKKKLPVLILLAIFCFTLLHMTACKDKKPPDNPDPPDVVRRITGLITSIMQKTTAENICSRFREIPS